MWRGEGRYPLYSVWPFHASKLFHSGRATETAAVASQFPTFTAPYLRQDPPPRIHTNRCLLTLKFVAVQNELFQMNTGLSELRTSMFRAQQLEAPANSMAL